MGEELTTILSDSRSFLPEKRHNLFILFRLTNRKKKNPCTKTLDLVTWGLSLKQTKITLWIVITIIIHAYRVIRYEIRKNITLRCVIVHVVRPQNFRTFRRGGGSRPRRRIVPYTKQKLIGFRWLSQCLRLFIVRDIEREKSSRAETNKRRFFMDTWRDRKWPAKRCRKMPVIN